MSTAGRAAAIFVLILLTALTACSDKAGQSYSEAISVLCDSPNHVPANLTPAGKGLAIGRWADAHISNGEARRFITTMISSAPDQKLALLQKAAAQAHQDHCALVDFWQAPPSAPTSPASPDPSPDPSSAETQPPGAATSAPAGSAPGSPPRAPGAGPAGTPAAVPAPPTAAPAGASGQSASPAPGILGQNPTSGGLGLRGAHPGGSTSTAAPQPR